MVHHYDGSEDSPYQAGSKYTDLIKSYKETFEKYNQKKVSKEILKKAEQKLCDYYIDNSSALRTCERAYRQEFKLIYPMEIIKELNESKSKENKNKEFPLIKPLDIEKIKQRVEERKLNKILELNKTPKKYVLTGGPSAGKSCLVYALEFEGYLAINEVAQKYISYLQAKGCEEPWKKDDFEKNLFYKQMFKEKLYQDKTLFLDRSVIDVWVYSKIMNQDVPEELEELIDKEKTLTKKTYDKIFYIEPLNSYKKEKYRRESQDEARITGEKIRDFYKELGYNVISIPDLGIDERVKMILSNL
jgi:predicted ATPase